MSINASIYSVNSGRKLRWIINIRTNVGSIHKTYAYICNSVFTKFFHLVKRETVEKYIKSTYTYIDISDNIDINNYVHDL